MNIRSLTTSCLRLPGSIAGCALFIPRGAASLLCAFALLAGCGSGPAQGSGSNPPPTQAPAITTQPASQIVPIDRAATFSVAATGSWPLSYQWSRNGQAIPGATSSSYTTPQVALADSGSTFQVTVSNSRGSVTSSAVTLTAGARAPAIGDVRYLLWQQVTIPWPPSDGFDGGEMPPSQYIFAHALGAPLTLGMACDWVFSVLDLPPTMNGFAMYYQEDANTLDTPWASWLQSVVAPNDVIISIDMGEDQLCPQMAAAWVATTPPGQFDFRLEEVTPNQVQATVAADGAEGRIVTATVFDDAAGKVVLISYGWQGDTTTVYEAQTVIAKPQDVVSQAYNLGNMGYFISAFGGNTNDGYVLVGMRVKGDTLPREITNDSQSFGIAPKDTAYGTVVANFGDANGGSGATIYEQ
ncbi:MAG: immunoglobulin domain-containing protein [Terracidiphilus sp.]